MKKKKRNWKEIKNYFIGNYRYWCYYTVICNFHFSRFIRTHILEQYKARVNSMHVTCYVEGSCKECGCTTTNLQFSNDACKGLCYPSMLSKERWEALKNGEHIMSEEISWYLYRNLNEKGYYEFCKVGR